MGIQPGDRDRIGAARATKPSSSPRYRELPVNILTCDLDFTIRQMNAASRSTLSVLEKYLPIPVSKIIGSSIDVFHKVPSHQRPHLVRPEEPSAPRDRSARPRASVAPGHVGERRHGQAGRDDADLGDRDPKTEDHAGQVAAI